MPLKVNPHFFDRKKVYDFEQTNLAKVLNLIDLTGLGKT